jgi:TetR/AcrR family transcriptional regulator
MAVERQRHRAPEAVRTSILDAALQLFADRGFAETSLRDISAASGVSHPLILHHFGSKEELYAAVKRRVVEGYAQRFPAAARTLNRPLSLRAEMKRIMTYLGENELALKLCARTRVDGDHQVWPGEPDLMDLLRQRLITAQAAGQIRTDLDAWQLSIMIVGVIYFWLDNRRYFAEHFRKKTSDNSYLKTAVSLIEDGLRPR